MSESAKRAGRHTWKEAKSKRDAARELGSIFEVLPEDEDHEDIVGNVEKKRELQAARANAVYLHHKATPVHRMR